LTSKTYFLIHNSIFVQIILTTTIVSLILICLHLKYRKTYNQKFEELIQNEIIDYEKKIEKVEEKVENSKSIRLENQKFEHFIHILNTKFNSS
jgi:hypothetical protein